MKLARGRMLIMKKNKDLEQSESRLTYLISQIKHKLEDDEMNKTYNRLLVERAVVRKQKEPKKNKNILVNFCEKLNRRRNPKLICDYF